jgi:hypothetical protein
MIKELVKKHRLSSEKKELYSISDAVQKETIDRGYDSDTADDAYFNTESLAYVLGNVVQMLHENGALSDDNILKLLDRYEEYKK